MEFFFFILVTAILFIRPTDFIPGLEGFNLYLIAIVPCILLSWHKLIPQLRMPELRQRPVFVLALGILLVSIVSNVVYRNFETGLNFTGEFLKLLILYLLMLAHLDSPRRIKLFCRCLVVIILIPILLAVADYDGIMHISAFDAYYDTAAAAQGIEITERRLQGTGNFADPNDVCEVVNCALVFSLYGLLDRGGGVTRVVWLAPLALLGHALGLTHSRGGFLGAVVALMVLFQARFRGIKSLFLAGAAVALMFSLFSGRQTEISTSEGTGQDRIQLWNAGFTLFTRNPVSPLIGVGSNGFYENVGHVAHNAFIQTYVELGFLGGTLLFGQYYYCLTNLVKLGSRQITLPDPEMRRLHPSVLAALASFAASEMSLTHGLSLITYVMFGLATAFIRVADPRPPLPDVVLNRKTLKRIVVLSGLFLLSLYVFTKLALRT